ncbi:MAG: DUF2062 domain-containing protein [Luteolibacter sp.]
MKQRYLKLVRQTFRTLRHRRLRHRSWWKALTRPLFARALWVPCRDSVATGLAVGLFFAMIPFIPQALCAAIVSMRLRGNIPFAVAACFVSNIFTNVPIFYTQIKLGTWLINTAHLPVPQMFLKAETTLPGIGQVGLCSFTVGFIASGLLLALLTYPVVHLLSLLMPHHLPVKKRPGPPLTPLRRNAEQ